MVITQILREFKIPISEEEPKKTLRRTNIYNVQTLYRMRFKKINGQWKREKGELRVPREDSSRPIEEDLPDISTGSIELAPSILSQLSEDEMRQIARYLVDELTTRGHMLVDHSNMVLI